MTLGVALLEHVFETFATKSAKKNAFERLYREAGIPAKKAYRNCSRDTKMYMVSIIPKDDTHTKNHLSIATTTRVLDELTRMDESKLLTKMYRALKGTSKKSFKYCKPKTRIKIQELGLHK